MLFAVTGCQTPQTPSPVDQEMFWPPPPAQPRIAYEKSIARPDDIGIRRSWWKRAAGYIVGSDHHELAFVKPTGLCLDDAGNLCVTDTGGKAVWFFDLAGKNYKRWNSIDQYPFSSPVAVVKRDKVIYVADSGLGMVIAFNESGKLLHTISDQLVRPTGLLIIDEKLWVVDSSQHRIEVFDLNGKHVDGFGGRGTAAGKFNFPTHVAVSTGETPSLYVTDALNFRVQEVGLSGQPRCTIGSVGHATGSFSRPKGLATDSDQNLYVVDALFDNIQIFDRNGVFLMHWGSSGTDPGFFWLPSGIAIDSNDRIWVADSYNRRIQVFKRMVDNEVY
jgi:DNA-binding beta-propeller fold protein YncE